MEVRPGYKKTGVGVIPENWEIKTLGEIGETLIGLTYKPSEISPDGILVLRSSNIQNETLTFIDNVFVKAEIPEKIIVREGDILICVRNGSRDLIGKCALIDERARGMTFGAFMSVFRTKFFKFIYHQFQASLMKKQINAHLGATINQITNKSMNSFCVPLPPTKSEQEDIAEALNDMNVLIESLEQLIAKKRQIKQGAMEELLTGKKRLPGFSGEWEIKQLGELFEVTSSKRVFQSEWKTSGVPFYRARELAVLGEKGHVENELFISKEMYGAYKKIYGVPKIGDMLVTGVGTLGKTYVVTDKHEFYFKDGNIIWFQISGKVCTEFLRQLYLTPRIIKQIDDFSCGTTVGTYTISAAKKTTIPFPSIVEQEAIGKLLSDMDAEIIALEDKLIKAQKLKQGMMLELLTGRIRLA